VVSTARRMTPLEADSQGEDGLLAAILQAVAVLERVRDQADDLIAAASKLLVQRREGRPWEEILRDEASPGLSVLLADNAEALAGASSRVRRAQVSALYRRGVPMHRIGSLLGITRQRVAVLLKTTRKEDDEVSGPTP
jgi:hypothetical protein